MTITNEELMSMAESRFELVENAINKVVDLELFDRGTVTLFDAHRENNFGFCYNEEISMTCDDEMALCGLIVKDGQDFLSINIDENEKNIMSSTDNVDRFKELLNKWDEAYKDFENRFENYCKIIEIIDLEER